MSKIAILVSKMFEETELRVPLMRLRDAGNRVEIVGLEEGEIVTGLHGTEKVEIEKSVRDVSERDYNALVIVGGYSPDFLRTSIDAVRFTRAMAMDGKPVAAICHAPWMLIEADVVDGRMVTSFPSVRTDLINAGARWVDREVVVDGNIVTSRRPADIDAFVDAILHELDAGVPERVEPMQVEEVVTDIEAEQPAPVVH